MSVINTNLSLPNDYAFGGIAEIYLIDKADLSGITATTGGTITAMTGTFNKVEFLDETASLNSEYTVSNGNRYMIESLSFSFPVSSESERNYFNELGKPATKVIAAIITKEGEKYLLGSTSSGLKLTVGTFSVGAAVGDAFGITATLSEAAKGFPKLLSGSFTLSGGGYTFGA